MKNYMNLSSGLSWGFLPEVPELIAYYINIMYMYVLYQFTVLKTTFKCSILFLVNGMNA